MYTIDERIPLIKYYNVYYGTTPNRIVYSFIVQYVGLHDHTAGSRINLVFHVYMLYVLYYTHVLVLHVLRNHVPVDHKRRRNLHMIFIPCI